MVKYEDFIYTIIGSKIKENRVRLGFNQTQLASELGVARSSISHLESGNQQIPIHIIYKICDYLKINLSDLLPTDQEIKENIIRINPLGNQFDNIINEDELNLSKETLEKISKLLNLRK